MPDRSARPDVSEGWVPVLGVPDQGARQHNRPREKIIAKQKGDIEWSERRDTSLKKPSPPLPRLIAGWTIIQIIMHEPRVLGCDWCV